MSRLIKRYDNRKLYDTEAKAYVSLQELAALIRQGQEIQVVENSTGEDITVQTLAKIILEGDRPSLPREALHEWVRWGGRLVGSTAAEIEQRLDRLLAASLERVGRIGELRHEFEQLRERIARLEALAARLEAALEESGR
ncbi:MAG: polyhydroxyalkanoate synthesis regulator DNA-binding domain-containing protein [Bryobacterales bacterium]|nr:polyhydroxyalkanoate synthesis regulator DNA-binding domain-containing protein [Bryobacteraceae bacterium]MDW8131269.1 polyhydroxyalkanoate synthesis regulator DNA-binding domain-containing protein [Bryobacterales bacterium]